MNIPDLPVTAITQEGGFPTPSEQQFRQNLVQSLQSVTSDEGLVPPSQTTVNITKIQNFKNSQMQFTCAPGTLIYNIDNDTLQVCILVAGVPTFKTITVS